VALRAVSRRGALVLARSWAVLKDGRPAQLSVSNFLIGVICCYAIQNIVTTGGRSTSFHLISSHKSVTVAFIDVTKN